MKDMVIYKILKKLRIFIPVLFVSLQSYNQASCFRLHEPNLIVSS